MLLFENERSKAIVERLIKSASAIRWVVIVYFVIILAVMVGILFYMVDPTSILWLIAGFAGGVLGLMIGMLLASVASVILEWMAQMLIAQGEILAQGKKK